MTAVKEYPTQRIRNVAVLGHAGVGKTTLIDALCFTAGSSSRKGNIQEGHALTMTSAEEMASAIVFLASPCSGHTTGQIHHIDGGYVHFDRSYGNIEKDES